MLVPKIIPGYLLSDGVDLSKDYDEYVEVVIRSDDDGHEYLIPKELESKFEALNAQIHDTWDAEEYDAEESDKAYREFETYFSHLRKEGHTPPLYAKVGYEKEL